MRFAIFFLMSSASLMRAQIQFPPDVTISRLEVVQTVQDEQQSVPLTAGKATAVRAFVKQDGRPENLVANISVVLRGYKDGIELPQSPVRTLSQAVTAQPAPDRANVNHAQNFILPMAWTQAGRLELRAELRLPAGTIESPSDNNTTTRTVEFVAPAVAEPRVSWLAICNFGKCPTGSFPYQRLSERLFPFTDGTLRYEDVPAAAINWDKPLNDDASMSALAAHLMKWRLLLDDSAVRTHAVAGWLPRGTQAVSQASGTASAFWLIEQADSAANEQLLGRMLSSGYPSSADPCQAITGEPGFDPLAGRLVPATRLELSTSCGTITDGPWLSPALAKFLTSDATPFRDSVPGREERLIISGTISDDGQVAMTTAFRASINVAATIARDATPYTIRVNSGDGSNQYPVSLPGKSFTVSVPITGPLTSVVLLMDDSEIARLDSANAAPTVTITSVTEGDTWNERRNLTWTATDPQNRSMRYTVFYASDGTAQWTPLAIDLTETQLAVDPSFLRGSTVSFRVVASSGADQGEGLSGTVNLGGGAILGLPLTIVDFNSITGGQIAERALTVANQGKRPLELTGLNISRDSFQPNTPSPFRVRAGTQRGLNVRYQPRVTGAEAAEMSFTSNDPARDTNLVTLRATIFDRTVPSANISTSSLQFGEVSAGQTLELPVVLRNDGTATLNVTNLNVTAARFSIVSPTGAFQLEPGAERTILIRFSPNAAGPQTGTATIVSNDPATPSLRIDLTGIGVVALLPSIDVTSTQLEFGGVSIGQTRILGVNVRNGGNGPLNISALTVTSNSAFSVFSPGTPIGVAPGATQVVSIRFAPGATGPLTATLTIASNDPNRGVVTVPLSGSGLPATPSPQPSVSSLVPGSLTVGSPRFNLTVNGANFNTGSVVNWNGSPRPTVFVSNTVLRGSISPDDVATANTATVSVVNVPPGGGTSNTLPVITNPVGPGAWITDFNLNNCPSVLATMTITDRIFGPITSLNSGNVACSEDGVNVPCNVNGAMNLGAGLSVVMVMHGSASAANPQKQRLDLLNMRRQALSFIDAMDIRDRLALTQMDNGVLLLRDFTDAENRDALHDAVDALSLRGIGTALYDSIEDGIRRLTASPQAGRRRAIVLFTASENTFDSFGPRDLNALFRLVQTSGVPIFFFPLGDAYQNQNLLALLNQFALDSSGRLFSDATIDAGPLMSQLATSLTNQQLLNFNTVNRDGQPHQLRVTVGVSGASFAAARSYPGCR